MSGRTRTTRVLLFEGSDRLLPTFPPDLSARAQRDLEKISLRNALRALRAAENYAKSQRGTLPIESAVKGD